MQSQIRDKGDKRIKYPFVYVLVLAIFSIFAADGVYTIHAARAWLSNVGFSKENENQWFVSKPPSPNCEMLSVDSLAFRLKGVGGDRLGFAIRTDTDNTILTAYLGSHFCSSYANFRWHNGDAVIRSLRLKSNSVRRP